MIGAGCGIGEHNLSQHSVKWCEKSGLEHRQELENSGGECSRIADGTVVADIFKNYLPSPRHAFGDGARQ